jgi:hypothetical protein
MGLSSIETKERVKMFFAKKPYRFFAKRTIAVLITNSFYWFSFEYFNGVFFFHALLSMDV